jgi:hypothetical protein
MTTERRAFDTSAFNGHRRARASLESSVNTAGNGKVCPFTFSVVPFAARLS